MTGQNVVNEELALVFRPTGGFRRRRNHAAAAANAAASAGMKQPGATEKPKKGG